MRQGRYLLGQNAAIIGHVLGANLDQIVKIARDEMRLLDLGHAGDGCVEFRQGSLAGVMQPHLDETHMIEPHPNGVHKRTVSCDHTRCLQPSEPRLRGGFRQADLARKLRHADPAINGQSPKNRFIVPI